MVFHEIDSITEVDDGHRIVIYYIKGKFENIDIKGTTLFKNTETALELLGKKNDDVLLIEILQNTNQFRQFVDLYKPNVMSPITLFAVNNEGIPLISENICEETNIFNAIARLSTACNLKEIPRIKETVAKHYNLFNDNFDERSTSSQEKLIEEITPLISSENKDAMSQKSLFTRLHIRLPNGVREELQFDNDTTLQVVWATISIKFNIKDFDLKTYNHSIFSEDDYEKTLKNLDLCPRGVLIVVNKYVVRLDDNGRISAIIQRGFYRLLGLPTSVFQYMRGLLFVFWNYIYPSNNGITSRRQGKEIKSSSNNSNPSRPTSQGTTRRYVPKNVGSNIHTLHRNDDSDEENNRYNGNSTQQK